ncbi:MAG: acyltransferase [Novosphingobium sp.]
MKMPSGREKFQRYKVLIRGLRRILSLFPTPMVSVVLLPFRSLRGPVGSLARYLVWSRRLGSLGEAVALAPGIVIKSPQNMAIGDRCSIHEFCYIDAMGGIRIGDDVAIAHNCSILSTNHAWDDPEVPIKYNAVKTAPVEIGNDVWIGCGVRILAGTKINERVVIAAGAVVRGELDSGFVYGGIPARKLKPL